MLTFLDLSNITEFFYFVPNIFLGFSGGTSFWQSLGSVSFKLQFFDVSYNVKALISNF